MSIDVVMLTKNSAKPYFKKCLASIRVSLPIKRIIIVDAYSTDDTIDIIKQFFADPIIIRTRQPLAQSRKLAISYVKTEWFAFIDSDIELFPNWFKILSKFRHKDVGGIQGKDLYANKVLLKWDRWQENVWKQKFLRRECKDVTFIDALNFLKNKMRGFTHNTLIRTSCVKDWDPPHGLHIGEDHHLFLHVIKKGYKWAVYNRPVCFHYAFLSLFETLNRAAYTTREVKRIVKCGYIEPKNLWMNPSIQTYFRILLISFGKALLASIYEKDPRILMYKLCEHGPPLLVHLATP
jgi:glycosyltransferase involved in cell wall biosynthesis